MYVSWCLLMPQMVFALATDVRCYVLFYSQVYVQKLVEEDGAELADLLVAKKGFFYICGDGAHMAKDVNAALLRVLQQHGDMSEAQATEYVADMVKEKRYVRDVWS